MTDGSFVNCDVYIQTFKNSLKWEAPLSVSCSQVVVNNEILLEYSAEFYLNEECNCRMKIRFSLNELLVGRPRSLRIKLTHEELHAEIVYCINFLQRQRNVDLAICVLQKALTLYSHRKAIFNQLLSRDSELIKIHRIDDGSFNIECSHNESFFFKSNWKIGFDHYIGSAFDDIEFIVTKRDNAFYEKVLPYMNLLTHTQIPFDKKNEFWNCIMENVTPSSVNSITADSIIGDGAGDNTATICFSPRSILYNEPSTNYVIDLESSDDNDSIVILE